MLTSQSVWYGAGVLGEVGLVEALSIAVSEQPGDLLLQHRPDDLRQLLALRHWIGREAEEEREMKGGYES